MNTFRGKTVYSDAQHLHVELEDGRVISTPMEWYEDLQKASPDQLSDYQFICQNTGIEWPGLDYHLSIESMMAAHIVLVPRNSPACHVTGSRSFRDRVPKPESFWEPDQH